MKRITFRPCANTPKFYIQLEQAKSNGPKMLSFPLWAQRQDLSKYAQPFTLPILCGISSRNPSKWRTCLFSIDQTHRSPYLFPQIKPHKSKLFNSSHPTHSTSFNLWNGVWKRKQVSSNHKTLKILWSWLGISNLSCQLWSFWKFYRIFSLPNIKISSTFLRLWKNSFKTSKPTTTQPKKI